MTVAGAPTVFVIDDTLCARPSRAAEVGRIAVRVLRDGEELRKREWEKKEASMDGSATKEEGEKARINKG